MRGLAVASPLAPAAAAALRRTRASSSGRDAGSQFWKYDLSQDRSLGGSLRIGQSQGNLHRYRSTNLLKPAAAAVSVEQDEVNTYLPKGDMWSVHKFGGTCMGTPQRIQSVADIVLGDSSERKLVIVSAMSKVTDMMYNLVHKAQSRDDSYTIALEQVYEKHMAAAKDILDGEDLARFLSQLHSDISNLRAMLRAIYIAGHATESFSDFVVGHGELWSAQMLSYAIKKSGAPCSWMDTREVLVVKPSGSNQVDPDYLESEKRLRKWFSRQPAEIIVATGFIASTEENIPTTLKRDGSDFSAAIIGSLVRARQVTIWTDVDGVFSADPRKVSEAVILSTLSYQEAWEMSYFGANVLHPRTIIPVMKDNIPIVIRNMFNISAPGTMICRQPANDNGDLDACVKSFATIDNLALVNVEGTGMAGVPGTSSAIFSAVKDVGANVIMISQASSEHSVCFAVPEKEVAAVSAALHVRFREALAAGRLSKVEVINGCSILAAVGLRMASTPGVSAILFDALAKANINVRAIAQGCSEYNITVVLKQEDCVRALRAAHSRFFLSKTTLAVGIIGPGLIGGTLLNQLKDQVAVLKENMNIDMRVIGITGSNTMLLSDTGIDLTQWKELLHKEGEPADLATFVRYLSDNHVFPNKVLVDCTADTSIASHYYDWLKKGIHVITPNKKANSGPLDRYLKLRTLQRASYTHYFYEATVGAGLPIISTLRGLLETGDRILRIEGIFSGTLSYIFNNFEGTRTFSNVVAEAKEAGYTEPDPRDDLSGTDVARKVIILARESGLRLELSDIPVKSLVPEALASCSSADEFMQKLPSFDEGWAKQRSDAEAAGEVLRYVGVVDVVNKEGQVELRRYKRDHPFAQLSGSDNIIAFTTSRYKEHSSPVEAAPMSRAQNLNSWDSVYDGYKFTMTTAANESSPTLQIPEKIDLHVNSTIIHEDIKPGNILLNVNMVPRISDFGISNLLMEEERTRTKESYIGTLGYVTPEYIYNNLNKFYMFSLGVIMMEILTGPTGYSNNPEMSSQHFTQIMKIIIEIGLSFVGIIEYVFLIPFVHDILVLRNSGASLSAAVDKINLLLDSDGKALAARPSMHQRRFFRSNLADERSDKPRSIRAPATNSSEETTHAPMANNKLTGDEAENHSDPNSCVIERDSNEKEKRSAEWYIATGAAHHATWKRDLFSNMVDVENDGRCVHAADGTPMPVCGRGDVVTDDVILPDVYYVPGLCTNLVSVGQLAGLDYCVGFGRGACVISNAAGAVVGRAHARGDGLYEVDFLRIPLPVA